MLLAMLRRAPAPGGVLDRRHASTQRPRRRPRACAVSPRSAPATLRRAPGRIPREGAAATSSARPRRRHSPSASAGRPPHAATSPRAGRPARRACSSSSAQAVTSPASDDGGDEDGDGGDGDDRAYEDLLASSRPLQLTYLCVVASLPLSLVPIGTGRERSARAPPLRPSADRRCAPAGQVLPLHWSEYQADVWFLLLSLATQYIGAARSRFTSPSASQRLTFRQVTCGAAQLTRGGGGGVGLLTAWWWGRGWGAQALAAPLVASASLLFVYWLIVSELVDVEALLVYYFGLVGFACLATFACAPLRVLADSLGVGGPRYAASAAAKAEAAAAAAAASASALALALGALRAGGGSSCPSGSSARAPATAEEEAGACASRGRRRTSRRWRSRRRACGSGPAPPPRRCGGRSATS
eukprot:scaffold1606_cov317-Prasinococcus_capsulatus_cf.AAC.3